MSTCLWLHSVRQCAMYIFSSSPSETSSSIKRETNVKIAKFVNRDSLCREDTHNEAKLIVHGVYWLKVKGGFTHHHLDLINYRADSNKSDLCRCRVGSIHGAENLVHCVRLHLEIYLELVLLLKLRNLFMFRSVSLFLGICGFSAAVCFLFCFFSTNFTQCSFEVAYSLCIKMLTVNES